MKAVLLVTVGTILIWLGLSGGDKSEMGSARAADRQLQPLDDGLGGVEPMHMEAPERPVEELGAGDGDWEDEDVVAQAAAAPAGPEVEVVEASSEPLPTESSRGPAVLDAPQPEDGRDVTPERVFELMSVSGDPMGLAQTLLESWVARDPGPIQDHLNSEAGAELPEDQRALVGAFWQALVGQGQAAEQEYERLAASEAVSSAQLELLGAAANLGAGGGVPANTGRRDALARSMRMVLLEESARIAALEGRHKDASEDLSELIHAELAAPWPPHRADLYTWGEALRASQVFHRLDKRGDWPGVSYTVGPNDYLEGIRKELVRANPGLRTSTGLIERVNGLGKYIHKGEELRVPTDQPNMLVDLDAKIAVYRHGTEAVLAWQVGIGRQGHETPIGRFEVGLKQREPAWHRAGHQPLEFGHPDNLLGTRWLGWHQDGEKTSFGFHGTNDPAGVGGEVSAGCIRMRNEDVNELFELLPLHSSVVVQP